MGFAVWIDPADGIAWAQGTHEYRPMGTAAIARADQFRPRDFRQNRPRPKALQNRFAGFFGSLEEVNTALKRQTNWRLRETPAHLL